MKHKKVLLGIGAGILLFAGLIFTLEKLHVIQVFSPSQEEVARQQEAVLNAEKKRAVISQQVSKSENSGSTEDNKASEGGSDTYTPPTNPENLEIAARQSGDTVTVTTKLVNYSDGNCTLKIVNGTRSTSMQARVIYQSHFSTCAGFSVPTSSVGAGNWNLELTVLSGGVSTSKSITISVN